MASRRNDGYSRRCSCPAPCRRRCRQHGSIDCKNIDRIIQALNSNFDDPIQLQNTISSQPLGKMHKKKSKAFKPRHRKDTCVYMTPSMHTRMRYISHCPIAPCSQPSYSRAPRPILRELRQKNVRYSSSASDSGSDTHIYMPTPVHFIKHTDSDQSIIKVPSPTTSGDVMQVQKAAVKPGEFKPPLPARSGHELIKPHSGIILNEKPGYIPDAIYMPGAHLAGRDSNLPCYMGKACTKAKCLGKKCRRYAAMIKRKRLAQKRRRGFCSVGYSSSKHRAPLRIRSLLRRKRGRRPHRYYDGDDDLCGLNAPKLDHPHLPQNLRRGALETHSLTILPCNKEKQIPIPFGILTASINMYDGKFGPKSKGRQALPMIVMAYCLAFHYHPKQWTTKLLDNLLDAGDTWYIQLLEKVHDHASVQGICEVLPFGKKQNLLLNGKKMQILLGEPDIVGYTMSLDPRVYNLCRGLKAFFMENRCGIMLTRILKVVIWRDSLCYYIFDPAGRDNKACTNFTNGAAALITVKDLNSVSEVILSRSVIDDQKYVLAPLKVLKMADEKSEEDFDSEPELTQTEKSLMSYRLLNENCAIVNANMHLGDRCFEESKNRQALPIAVAAMTYAKISPPNSWFTKTLDKILRMGNKLYVDSLPHKQLTDITIDNIPNEISLGPYTCEIIIYRERVKGQLFTCKECLLNIRRGLEEFFSREHNSGILEFNNYFIAIWRQKDMYYLFDCYPRTHDGARSLNVGKACCLMLLNPSVMAEVFKKNWDYLPPTTQFYIHAFKVLKLKKKAAKNKIVCTLSNEAVPRGRKVLKAHKGRGDSVEHLHNILPLEAYDDKNLGIFNPDVEEEQMGDIVSLVDSIQEDYLPSIPMKYKKMPPDPEEQKVFNLDSPTVSLTQVVPPWPKPRDKSNELPEPDPDPEPTPPPTPPELPPPEGGLEEAEEEEDEDAMERRKEEEKRKKAEEEEARRKAEELPPPLPPPPPTPLSELEVPMSDSDGDGGPEDEEEVHTAAPVDVNRRILLTEDAQVRSKLREMRKKMTPPLTERAPVTATSTEEINKPTNFITLPDGTQILRGKSAISGSDLADILPFVSIMALVTSYKYAINTWSSDIVSFVLDTAKTLHKNKKDKFQLSPIHIIPKIAIGKQAYAATIDVIAEGPSWNMEAVLSNEFLDRYDRGMITAPSYSCAFFHRNGLYYLYDGSPCNAMGIRDFKGKDAKGKSCFLRFRKLKDLVARIQYNKDKVVDQQFIVSRILVRRLLTEQRLQLPEDHDYETGTPKNPKSKSEVAKAKERKSSSSSTVSSALQKRSELRVGYKEIDGQYKIEGTATVTGGKTGGAIQSCHFISLIAMLMATMHPIRTWTPQMVDICVEKGLEIAQKTNNFAVCEKRVIKNLILEGKIININIKKIVVINNNPDKDLEQFVKAVMKRLRYTIIEISGLNMVICKTEGYYHLFDPYPRQSNEPQRNSKDKGKKKDKKKDNDDRRSSTSEVGVASWTLFRTIDLLIYDLNRYVKSKKDPSFYTFELTSAKTAPKYASYYYKLSPNYRPEANPNAAYLKPRKQTPLVDEKMYWLETENIPWSRMNLENDLGLPRNTPRTMWKNWDIELPGDLLSIWGYLHPSDSRFDPKNRGKQYLATCVVALAMAEMCDFDAWTGTFLDGIVNMGDKYHSKCLKKVGERANYELNVEDLDTTFDEKYPFSFTVSFSKVIFGFVYNMLPDRFNLSNALSYFFESNKLGILVSPGKNLAFGRNGSSYFMFDCQSFGAPLYCPGQGGSYVLKCEGLNRLLYCMIMALNIRKHGQQFHLYAAEINVKEK